MSADREPTAGEVIAEAYAKHPGWAESVLLRHRCTGCDALLGSGPADAAHRDHLAKVTLAALKAAGFVVATRDEIRAMTPQQQAELIGGEVHMGEVYAVMGEPDLRALRRVAGPWREVQP